MGKTIITTCLDCSGSWVDQYPDSNIPCAILDHAPSDAERAELKAQGIISLTYTTGSCYPSTVIGVDDAPYKGSAKTPGAKIDAPFVVVMGYPLVILVLFGILYLLFGG